MVTDIFQHNSFISIADICFTFLLSLSVLRNSPFYSDLPEFCEHKLWILSLMYSSTLTVYLRVPFSLLPPPHPPPSTPYPHPSFTGCVEMGGHIMMRKYHMLFASTGHGECERVMVTGVATTTTLRAINYNFQC